MTIVIDDFSRAIAGCYLGLDPRSSFRTSLALRQGIWRKDHAHWHIMWDSRSPLHRQRDNPLLRSLLIKSLST
jgi:hypothetical protein